MSALVRRRQRELPPTEIFIHRGVMRESTPLPPSSPATRVINYSATCRPPPEDIDFYKIRHLSRSSTRIQPDHPILIKTDGGIISNGTSHLNNV